MKKNLTDLARELRKRSTEAEKLLWGRLSRKQLEGFKFRRQQPIGPYIADFVSFDTKLIIELDGGQHAAAKDEDDKRDEWLKEQGFEVLRFWDNEVFENLHGILETVRSKLTSPPPAPPTRGGETGIMSEPPSYKLQGPWGSVFFPLPGSKRQLSKGQPPPQKNGVSSKKNLPQC